MLKEYVDYVVGAVPKLIVDTTKVLREGNLVGANLRVDFLWHHYTFGLSIVSNDEKYAIFPGTLCGEPSPAYDCDECEFILHKSCAELPDKGQYRRDDCPPFLKAMALVCSFQEKHACDAKMLKRILWGLLWLPPPNPAIWNANCYSSAWY